MPLAPPAAGARGPSPGRSAAPAASAPTLGLGANPNGPLAPGLPPSSVTTTASTPTATGTSGSSTDSGLSGSNAIAIGLGALVVLAGISLFIWRDARRRAPVRERTAAAVAGAGGRPGSKPRAKPRKPSAAERRRRKRGRAR